MGAQSANRSFVFFFDKPPLLVHRRLSAQITRFYFIALLIYLSPFF